MCIKERNEREKLRKNASEESRKNEKKKERQRRIERKPKRVTRRNKGRRARARPKIQTTGYLRRLQSKANSGKRSSSRTPSCGSSRWRSSRNNSLLRTIAS